ncbi:hypothetical protein FACS189441_7240 [Betaproteobacteria bacterium]|nr:hypothetical protein FACS189441_7240 [Betaproteobacteria bacterium]
MYTTEAGRAVTFSIRLGKAPADDVIVPLFTSNAHQGIASPTSLTFTSKNWATNQTVTVTGQNDCAPDGSKTYQVFSGKAQSVDPDYVGLSGSPVKITNQGDIDLPRTTNNSKLHICGLTMVSESKPDARTWEYTLRAELSNTGASLRGVVAHLRQLPISVKVIDDALIFGAIGQGETVKTEDTVTLRSFFPIPDLVFKLGIGFLWKVEIQP